MDGATEEEEEEEDNLRLFLTTTKIPSQGSYSCPGHGEFSVASCTLKINKAICARNNPLLLDPLSKRASKPERQLMKYCCICLSTTQKVPLTTKEEILIVMCHIWISPLWKSCVYVEDS